MEAPISIQFEYVGLTLGESVTGSSVKVRVALTFVWPRYIYEISQDIIQVAFDNGINMFDTAEGYNKGQSEIAMYVLLTICANSLLGILI